MDARTELEEAEKKAVAITIHEDQKVAIRDLAVGELFVRPAHVRRARERGKIAVGYFLRKTENQFKAMTLLDTPITVFPSDMVFRVTMLGEGEET